MLSGCRRKRGAKKRDAPALCQVVGISPWDMLLQDGKSADYLAKPVLGIHSILITQRAGLPDQFIAQEMHSSIFCLTQLLTLAGQVFCVVPYWISDFNGKNWGEKDAFIEVTMKRKLKVVKFMSCAWDSLCPKNKQIDFE